MVLDCINSSVTPRHSRRARESPRGQRRARGRCPQRHRSCLRSLATRMHHGVLASAPWSRSALATVRWAEASGMWGTCNHSCGMCRPPLRSQRTDSTYDIRYSRWGRMFHRRGRRRTPGSLWLAPCSSTSRHGMAGWPQPEYGNLKVASVTGGHRDKSLCSSLFIILILCYTGNCACLGFYRSRCLGLVQARTDNYRR